MLSNVIGDLILVLFFATEGRARKGAGAKSFGVGPFDRGSTRLVKRAVLWAVLGLLLAPLLNHFHLGQLKCSGNVGWFGVAVATAGVGLRLWANQTLGAFYTRTLRVEHNQSIIQQGPYRFIRHPGYLGSLLLWSGVALSTMNGLVLGAIGTMMCFVYHQRIQAEEEMLTTWNAEDYRAYCSRSWRLLPFVY